MRVRGEPVAKEAGWKMIRGRAEVEQRWPERWAGGRFEGEEGPGRQKLREGARERRGREHRVWRQEGLGGVGPVGFRGWGRVLYEGGEVGYLDASRSSVPSADQDPSLSCATWKTHNKAICLSCISLKAHNKLSLSCAGARQNYFSTIFKNSYKLSNKFNKS
jgi:hypothetical protein